MATVDTSSTSILVSCQTGALWPNKQPWQRANQHSEPNCILDSSNGSVRLQCRWTRPWRGHYSRATREVKYENRRGRVVWRTRLQETGRLM